MSKGNKEASSFLAKFKKQIVDGPKTAVNAVGVIEPPNAFRSVFCIEELDPTETEELKDLLANAAPEERDARAIQQDVDLLKSITAEIKSIQKQSVLLLGERIARAREILKSYGDDSATFTKWLDTAFSSRRTAYNCMAYFEFYQSIPSLSLRELLKQMSHKAVYMLASREGSIEKKMEIIEKYYDLKQDEIIPIIQDFFPVFENEKKRESALENDLNELGKVIERLLKRRQHLKKKHLDKLVLLKELFFEVV